MGKRFLLLLAVSALLLLTAVAAFAAVDLGVDELTLNPGESYEFEPLDGMIRWSVSDESVIAFTGDERIGITALKPGTALVLAMSEDHSETDYCVVTVNGTAEKTTKSAELYYQQLIEEDLAKVKDPALAAVLRLASDTEKFPLGVGSMTDSEYKVLVSVKEGTAQKIADAAEALGLADVWAYKYVSMVALRGDANGISFLLVNYRNDIVSVEPDQVFVINPDDDLVGKDISNLGGNAEELTDVSAMHDLGFKGAGQYIAIIDSGIKSDHAEFKDADGNSRVAYQHCFSSTVTAGWTTYNGKLLYVSGGPICENRATEAESGAPSGAQFPENFTHGTHVAGIAAGNHGVAPEAKIIAIQAFTEIVYYTLNNNGTKSVYLATSGLSTGDEQRAMEYLMDLVEQEGIVPASINMSYGNGEYKDYTAYTSDSYLSRFLKMGTVPCAASGNDGYTGYICIPAASKYTFTVGALSNQSTPSVSYISNHSKLVNILAPGIEINSSVSTGTDAYEIKSGTSMAAPMVSGAFALLRQMYPTATAAELESLMLAITDQSASRSGITVPVLNLANVAEYYVNEPVAEADYVIESANRAISVTIFESGVCDGYKVELYTSAGKRAASKLVAAEKDKVLTFSGLTNDAVYYVKIWSYREVNKYKYYSDCTIQTPMVPMAVPTGLTLTALGADSVTAVWPKHENDTIEVQYSENQAGAYSVACAGSGSCTVSGLKQNRVYYFRFHWYNNECSSYSPVSAVSTILIPAEPTNVNHKIGSKKIRVYFDDDATLTGHQVKVYIVSTGKLAKTVNFLRTKNPTYGDITGLTNGIAYRFEVCSYATVNKQTYYSDDYSFTAVPQLKPEDSDSPANVASAVGNKSVTISWNKDTWVGGHYVELRRTDNRVLVANAYAAASAASYTFSGGKIDYDVPYMVRVWKYNEKTPKATGNTYVDMYAVSLATPANPVAAAADGSITVSWTYSGIADTIEAWYSTSSNGTYQLGCSATGSEKSCVIPNLSNGTLYYVKLRSVYELEGTTYTSVYSAVKNAMPLPVTTGAVVTPGSKSLKVQYSRDASVTGHIIQLYKLNGTKASLVKTVTSVDKTDPMTVSFTGLANNTTYRVSICSYLKVGSQTYRGAITSTEVTPSLNAAESKEVLSLTEYDLRFEGFVDPISEDNEVSESETDETIEAIDAAVSEEEKQPAIFDLFRLW